MISSLTAADKSFALLYHGMRNGFQVEVYIYININIYLYIYIYIYLYIYILRLGTHFIYITNI